jgi:hypothetical protein
MLRAFIEDPAIVSAVLGAVAMAVRAVWSARQAPDQAAERFLRLRVGRTVIEYRSAALKDGAGEKR